MINRIKQVMEYKQMSPTTFADTIQINRSSLTHIFSGRNQPSLDIAKKILNAFPEVNTEWLIMGVGAMLKTPEKAVEETEMVPVKTVDNMLQTDLFGDVFDETPVEEEVEKEIEEPSFVEQPVQREEAVIEPEPEPEPEPVMPVEPKPVVVPRKIQRASESKISTSSSRREKNLNSQHDKKIEKIIFFYEDNSFEIFRPNC